MFLVMALSQTWSVHYRMVKLHCGAQVIRSSGARCFCMFLLHQATSLFNWDSGPRHLWSTSSSRYENGGLVDTTQVFVQHVGLKEGSSWRLLDESLCEGGSFYRRLPTHDTFNGRTRLGIRGGQGGKCTLINAYQ